MKFTFPVAVLVLILVALVSGAFYTVKETEQVIITKFGRPVGDPIKEPGLHFKIPFIHKANFFPKNSGENTTFQRWITDMILGLINFHNGP